MPSIPGRDGRIGLPSRALGGGDQPAPWPDLYGGPGGTVALPSRDRPLAPQVGPIADTAASGIHADPRTTADPPAGTLTFGVDYGRENPTPHAIYSIHYLRRFVSTTAAVLDRMADLLPATTSGTMNNTGATTAPSSPIPAFRRFVVETIAEPYGWGRIWNDNLPPPDIQKPAQVRRLLSSERLPRMGSPYQPKLTRLAMSPAAGTPTDVTLVPGGRAGNPYAGGA